MPIRHGGPSSARVRWARRSIMWPSPPGVRDRAGERPPRGGNRRRPGAGAAVSAAPHIALAPPPGAEVVSLDEWRARRAPVEADVPEPAPLRLLRLVVDGEEPAAF